MSKALVIAERDNIAAVVEDGRICEFYVQRGDMLLNDVYLATVDNVLPSIDAAFVNVGYDKMGFLHAHDAIGKGSLKDKVSPKQKIVVQVVKEPTGHKGPRVTTAISLPGRFLVLMPSEVGINVSRKIVSQKERARLKSIISLIKPVGLGVIVRTEAEGQSDADIQEDLEILLEKWNSIVTAAETREAPSLLYRDQDLLYRVMREACSEDVDEIIVDTSYAMHRTQQILQNWNMSKNIELNVYKGDESLVIAAGMAKEIKSALQTKVNLPSGGYLFVQTTEALTVIDVNSGKFVSSNTQDETILKTNQEAVHEIARQLRLRNIGGMVIVDFIDMNTRNDKLALMEELEIVFEKDKAKPQVGQLSDLGLVELTRHRQGQSLAEIFSKKCPHCQGNGYIADDLTFSSPVSEGEMKAKAAKLKIPVQQLKNKNKQNNLFNNHNNQNQQNNNQQNVQNTQQQTEKINQETPQQVVENNIEQTNDNNKQDFKKKNNYQNKNNRKNRYEKPVIDSTTSLTGHKDEEIKETIQQIQNVVEDEKPQIQSKIETSDKTKENIVEKATNTKNNDTTIEKVEEVKTPETETQVKPDSEPKKTKTRKTSTTKKTRVSRKKKEEIVEDK